MRELFVMDLKNYDPNGTVGRRPSVRGIIIRNGRIAMMHSCRYDYYKLPGGGIEPGESLEETLVREVQEESGLVVKKHFYAGGSNSLRGWQARTVGPGLAPMDTSFVIPNQTGDMKLEANIEYRFDMFWKVAGAVFVDAGNVWALKADSSEEGQASLFRWQDFGRSIAANWGVGLRLDFGFLLLRVDMGMKIHDPARKQRWVSPEQWFKRDNYAVHFGVGYPF